jgi:hypothetical protein
MILLCNEEPFAAIDGCHLGPVSRAGAFPSRRACSHAE